ncbi:hypothetical protein Val02_60930 [Virgisporangium aliadipatigenens]|uniref:Rrf2 family transcriptional regulator n=1 Tax=Virgisporangium aliadipatigenens TaxID=741659 RepID=A0A8J3YRL4_9ACTN|nr:Rrf2 family transcriptional regulator [Virgisporangium aliadipatigenens]GIJ49207.1 hypothetical protein Val02_60930 [Virgisporangium aliadipatigenens]
MCYLARGDRGHDAVHISARTDYAVRAMLVIAEAHPRFVRAAEIATAQQIPAGFLTSILVDLRRGGLVLSYRGNDGGYGLARAAEAISLGEILRVMDGELTTVRGRPTVAATYGGTAQGLREVWISLDEAVSGVVDGVRLADLVAVGRTGG